MVRRARRHRRLCCCSSYTGHSAPGHSAPGQRKGRRWPAPGFLRPRLRRTGSAEGVNSCRQRLSARRLTILGASRRRIRGPPGAPTPRGALAELDFAPRCPVTHSLCPSNLAAPPASAQRRPPLRALPRWPPPARPRRRGLIGYRRRRGPFCPSWPGPCLSRTLPKPS